MADPDAPERPARAGDFERYALLAALTLVVLCLLLVDRRREVPAPSPPPAPDRALRVEIGGPAPGHVGAPPRPPARPPAPPPPSATRSANPPAPVQAPAATPEQAPPRTYVVRADDTLWGIARRELGSVSRAGEIARLNGLADPDRLRVGQVLRLPER